MHLERIHSQLPFYQFHDVDSFLAFYSVVRDEWGDVWHRGHSSKDYFLYPSVYRRERAMRTEQNVSREFVRRASVFFPDVETYNYCRWLFLMQHYGLPTRLLDWSESLSVALYFAFENGSNFNPCIWLMNPTELNLCSIGEQAIPTDQTEVSQEYCQLAFSFRGEDRKHVGDLPIALVPQHFDQRMIAQRACFTVNGLSPEPLELQLFDTKGIELEKIFIRASFHTDSVEAIANKLSFLLPSRSQLFPGIDGLVHDIRQDWFL